LDVNCDRLQFWIRNLNQRFNKNCQIINTPKSFQKLFPKIFILTLTFDQMKTFKITEFSEYSNKQEWRKFSIFKKSKSLPDHEEYYMNLFHQSFQECLLFDYPSEATSLSITSLSNKTFIIKQLHCHDNRADQHSQDYCWQIFKEYYHSQESLNIKLRVTHLIETDFVSFHFLLKRDQKTYSTVNIRLIPQDSFKKTKKQQPIFDIDKLSFDIKSIIVLPCHSEHQLNPKRRRDYPCKHTLLFTIFYKDCNQDRLFHKHDWFVDGEIIKQLGSRYEIFRAPCCYNEKCLFNNYPSYSSNTTERTLTMTQSDTDIKNLEQIVKMLFQTNIYSWKGTKIPFTVDKTTYLCVLVKHEFWDINLTSVDLRFSNLTFKGIKYHKGIDRYFDVCINGKEAKKQEKANDDWGIYINFAPMGTLLIQLESIITHKEKYCSEILPFLNEKIFDLPKSIEIFSCASHDWLEAWGGDFPECRHQLYLVDKDSERPSYFNFLSYYSPKLTMNEIEKLGLFSREKIIWSTYEKVNSQQSGRCQMKAYLLDHHPNIFKNIRQKHYG
jgi:hypothetical protein